MRPFHIPRSGLLVVLAGLVALQLAVAVPAQARAGDLDPTFGTGGKVTTDFAGRGEEALALALQDNGRIVAAGRTDESDVSALGDFALARYLHDGRLDTGFGVGGKVQLDFSGSGGDDVAEALVVQDGRPVAGGHALSDWALARFRRDGRLDASFGSGGKVTTPLGGTIHDLALQADGKLVAAGSSRSNWALARYNADGTLDPTFGTDGVVTTIFPDVLFAEAFAVAVQPDGRIVAAGHAGGAAFALARYNPDGSLDPTFGGDGTVTTAFGGFFNEAFALVVQGNGRIVAAGENFGATAVFALARYRQDGSLDPSFGGDGTVTTDFGGSGGGLASDLVAQADGRLVAAGAADHGTATGFDFALARYRQDGSLDASFGGDGTVTTDLAGGSDGANALALQSDGRLVAAGGESPDQFGVSADFALARYRAS
jgi:uncharacterized delta-60 repeat protein